MAEDHAYTRDGSRTIVMDNASFRELIERRERLIDQKLREIADTSDHVPGKRIEVLADFIEEDPVTERLRDWYPGKNLGRDPPR